MQFCVRVVMIPKPKNFRMNTQLPLSDDVVLGKDVHPGRDGNPSVPRKLFAAAHSVAHTPVLMSTHSSKVGW